MIIDNHRMELKILYFQNRQKLLNKMENNSIAILFSEPIKYRNSSLQYPYRQNSNIIYLTGIFEPIHSLWLSKDSYGNTDIFLLIPEYDEKTIIYQGSSLSPDEIKSISGIEKVFSFKDTFYQYLDNYKTIYCEKENKKHLPCLNDKNQIQDINPILGELRIIKNSIEIKLIQKAISITGEVYHQLLRNFKTFKKESDIEAFITYHFIKKGNLPHAYLPIVANGTNALTLHYTKNNKRLHKNLLTLLDFGCEYKGYASDLSRTVPNNGKFNKRATKVYNKVLEILNNVSKYMVEETSINELNMITLELMEKALKELKIIKSSDLKTETIPSLCKKYFPHGVSHFIGIDVHDCGNAETKLKTDMILSCEPGIYIPEENMGIRIENNILVSSKPVNLMRNIATSVDEIESLMND